MIKSKFRNIFHPTEDGRIRLSEEAPDVLFDAIKSAKQNLDQGSGYVIRAIGRSRRALDFGIENLTPIQTESATIFAGDVEQGTKVLAVGVSNTGSLTREQINQAISRFAKDATLSPEELAKSEKVKKSLRSIGQAKNIVNKNTVDLLDKIAEIEVLLSSLNENIDEINQCLDDAELCLHNVLSSVYTFIETVEQSLRNLGVLNELKYHIQRYEDKNSAAIGLRHCIQHNFTLKIKWVSKYSHDKNIFNYRIGVPVPEVKREELYTKNEEHNAAGEKYVPIQYYYKDIDNYIIDIEKMSQEIKDSTNKTSDDIKQELNDRSIDVIDTTERFFRLGQYRMQGDNQN